MQKKLLIPLILILSAVVIVMSVLTFQQIYDCRCGGTPVSFSRDGIPMTVSRTSPEKDPDGEDPDGEKYSGSI